MVLPTVFVSTIYPGASPSDIENSVTKPLEKKLKAVSGVKKLKSSSMESISMITVEFNSNVSVADAKLKVKDAVDKAKVDIPADAQKNQAVQEFDISEMPVMNINLSGNYDAAKLKKYAEDLKDKIEMNKEITRCDIIGALDREVKVNLDLYKMQAAYVSFSDIENALMYNNMNISGGDITVGELRRTLRVTGEIKTVDQIRNLIFKGGMGNQVKLSEIAEVTDAFKDRESYARLDNKPVVSLNIIKRSGENLINAAEKIKLTLEESKKSIFPSDLKVTITGDLSTQTQNQLNDLINTVILGFLFVTIVLMFFMGVENAFYVGLSVPLSSLLAFLFMPGLHFTLNVIVLFSFLLALGIVVDDAIVVIENTHRIFNKHKDKTILQAAREAAGEVFWPVFSGTLVNIAPFFPLLFWPGIVGKFMYYLPVTLIITLFASLVVAFIINPVFAVTFMKRDHEVKTESIRKYKKTFIVLGVVALLCYLSAMGGGKTAFGIANFLMFVIILLVVIHYLINPLIHRFQDGFLPRLKRGYTTLVTAALKGYRPLAILFGTIGFLVLSMFLLFGLRTPKVDFFPQGDPNFTFVSCELPTGTDLRITDSITKILEAKVYDAIKDDKDLVESVISNVAVGAGDMQNPDRTPQSHKSKITVAYKEFAYRHGKSTATVLAKIRAKVKAFPGAQITVEQEHGGPPTGKAISVEISGENFDSLIAITARLKKLVDQSGIKGIENLKSDLVLNKPELKVKIDIERAQREGISVGQIGGALFASLNGSRNPSKMRDDDDEIPVNVRLAKQYREKPEDLLNLIIAFRDITNGQYRQISLASVATVQFENNFSGINRKNQKRVVTLGSGVVSGFNGNEINTQHKSLFATVKMPEGYEIKQTGEQEDQKETSDFLGVAFLATIALMFVIIVIQFNSASKPLIIFSTIIFSLIGVFLGYFASGDKMIIVMTGVGIMSLAGIVVKNGIILIEFIDELKARGYKTRQAIIEGGATRMTPVILTACAAILGLIPLALGVNIDFAGLFTHFKPNIYLGGESVVFWGPLAWTIIYGLVIATFLTLIVSPCLYLMRYRLKVKQQHRKLRRKISKGETDFEIKM
ncbi:MAG: efflux RND transporter permease subunit [Bacteroidetes bacterium]|nr:efflux RND transporter permease subunit [Bacteroidota bacterium]